MFVRKTGGDERAPLKNFGEKKLSPFDTALCLGESWDRLVDCVLALPRAASELSMTAISFTVSSSNCIDRVCSDISSFLKIWIFFKLASRSAFSPERFCLLRLAKFSHCIWWKIVALYNLLRFCDGCSRRARKSGLTLGSRGLILTGCLLQHGHFWLWLIATMQLSQKQWGQFVRNIFIGFNDGWA